MKKYLGIILTVIGALLLPRLSFGMELNYNTSGNFYFYNGVGGLTYNATLGYISMVSSSTTSLNTSDYNPASREAVLIDITNISTCTRYGGDVPCVPYSSGWYNHQFFSGVTLQSALADSNWYRADNTSVTSTPVLIPGHIYEWLNTDFSIGGGECTSENVGAGTDDGTHINLNNCEYTSGQYVDFGLEGGSDFYAQIKSTSNGRWLLHSTPASSTNNLIERLPQDWTVFVSSTVSATGSPILSDGYRWYDVIDPTDGVEGWMAASDASDTTDYLSYSTSINQDDLAIMSATTTATTTNERADFVFDAIDHYYNNTSTANSLYSSDDGNSALSMFSNGVFNSSTVYSAFPEQIILGIAAQETGGIGFNNNFVQYDYGSGVMQLTPYEVWGNEATTTGWLNNAENIPANSSYVEDYPCRSYDEFNEIGTSTYVNCYTFAGDHDSTDTKAYQPYAGNSSNPTYAWYGNTEQSIYANIKDGMRVLQNNYQSDINSPITTSTVDSDSITYTGQEREIIIATAAYGPSLGGDPCAYLSDVADRANDLAYYFPDESTNPILSTSSIADILDKMYDADIDAVCAELHSPATLSIEDAEGHVVGMINGKQENNFPLAVSDPMGKWAEVLAAGTGNYTYKVTGAGTGTYGFDITIKHGNKNIVFSTSKMPIIPGQIDTYTVDTNDILKGQKGVMLQVDTNGDGVINKAENFGATVQDIPPDGISVVSQ